MLLSNMEYITLIHILDSDVTARSVLPLMEVSNPDVSEVSNQNPPTI